MHLPSKKKPSAAAVLVTLIYLKKKKEPQPWQRWIDVLICLFNRRFPLQLLPCLSLVLLRSGRGRACIFMVINTCAQSFNLPYLSHVTVWLHCLIWVSFNLSRPRLEINEGRKRHIWVSYSAKGVKGMGWMGDECRSFDNAFSFFSCVSLIPVLCRSLSLSLPSCLAARCSPFLHCSPQTGAQHVGPLVCGTCVV